MLCDIEKVPFENNYFDVAVLKDLIEHVPYYDELLSKLCKIAKVVILSVFIKLNEKEDKIVRSQEGYYMNSYNKDNLIDFFKMHGKIVCEQIFEDQQDQVWIFK